jgi:hypothetical protein
MALSITTVLYLLAFICFILAAANAADIRWMNLGFAFLTLSLFVR